ncbi:hypothetical protein GQ54DRAFT_301262 [Martensiomyces pterosporus]|nr:hypothetical protein GQ54DRAFT_301262 [Martensiomyces pterosporus]
MAVQTQQLPMGMGGGHQAMNEPGSIPLAGGYEWNGRYPAQQQQQHVAQDISVVPVRGGIHSTTKGTQPLRSKISERLLQIDREAFESEEKLYQQKGEEIQSDLTLILRGTHPMFLEGVARLAAERDRMLASAEQNHRYLVSMHDKAYQRERDLAEKAYKSEKQTIYDKIAADIEERRKRLKEEKDNLDISMDFVFDTNSRTSSKRNLRKRGHDLLGLGEPTSRHQNKRKHAQGVTMVGIPEEDIVSDLVALRRATGVTGPLGNGVSGKKGAKGHKR